MSMNLTVQSLSEQLGRVVAEVEFIIAKNDVAGLPPEIIAKTLGVTTEEVQEIQKTQDYKDVRLLLGFEQAKLHVGKDTSWDSIESFALGKLQERLPSINNDTDTLLKIAAIANKAERRNQQKGPQVLDPQQGVPRIPLQLTRRFVERVMTDGTQEREETQQISLMNGTAINPTFKEIDAALGVSLRPQTLDAQLIPKEGDFGIEDLIFGGKEDR